MTENSSEANQISQVTRRNIVDAIVLGEISWSGRLDEVEFLSRIFALRELPSRDYRYANAAGDIRQHRINNNDWSDEWVFYDNRFEILDGPDEAFLRFLCEVVH